MLFGIMLVSGLCMESCRGLARMGWRGSRICLKDNSAFKFVTNDESVNDSLLFLF